MQIIKLTRMGNSMCVVLPADYRRKLGINLGDQVVLEMTRDRKIIIGSLKHALENRKKSTARGASDLSNIGRRLRVPAD